MKKTNIVLLVFALLVLIASLYSFSQTYFVVEKKNLNTSIQIGNTTGINLENESLAFGRMMPKTSVQRHIEINNPYSNHLLVNLTTRGNISNFIFHKNMVRIEPSKTKEIGVGAKIPKNLTKGNYSGKFTAIMKKRPF
ncbi:MAG: hypothetical protein ABEI74_01195 [Candidatus Pacearchaeota archaeon]